MTMSQRYVGLGLAIIGWITQPSCSHVSYLYTAPHYADHLDRTVKRIVVAGWAPATEEGLAPALTQVTADLIKLRKNFLVTELASEATSPAALCAKGVEGVVLVRSLGEPTTRHARRVHLRLAVELVGCRDGLLIYRSEGDASSRPDDSALSEVTRNYAAQLGEKSRPFIAPAFVILQQLIEPLYNPELSEKDIEEKIELGLGEPLPSLRQG